MSISKKEVLLSCLKIDINSILNGCFTDLDKATDNIGFCCQQLNLLKQIDFSSSIEKLKEKSLDVYHNTVADLYNISTVLEHSHKKFKQKTYAEIVCLKEEEISCYNKNIFLNIGNRVDIVLKDIKLFIELLVKELDVYIMNTVHNTEIDYKEFKERITEFVENVNGQIKTFQSFIRFNFNSITTKMCMIK